MPGVTLDCPDEHDVPFVGLDCEGYRLPTEAEWEYAARAGSTDALYTGPMTTPGRNNCPELSAIAWYAGNSGVDYESDYDCSSWKEREQEASVCGTHPVAQKPPNAFGLYDVLGNVQEWAWDRHSHTYYEDRPNPVTDPLGPETGGVEARSRRGGSWSFGWLNCRLAYRGHGSPHQRHPQDGFRPARTVVP